MYKRQGIIETSSGELDAVKVEIAKMRELTDEPFGVNIAQLFVKDPDIVGELRPVLARYASDRQPGERFGDWSARVLWNEVGAAAV